MSDIDIVIQLKRIAKTMEAGHWVSSSKAVRDAAAEIKRLRAERDEARQRYCFAMAEHGEEAEARQNAKDEGWDCFKEASDER